MADTKISALTSAGSLAGTEVLPIVQSSATKKVAIDTLVARAVASGSAAAASHTHAAAEISDSTSAGRALLTAADAAAQRTALALGTAAQSATGDFAAASHTHAASEIASGTIATARLGSGTANSGTYLRGDQTWAAVSGGGGGYLDNATTSDPTSGDDSGNGYSVGSRWLNTSTGVLWIALVVTVGAAVWMPLAPAQHVGYVSGRYYAPFPTSWASSGAAASNTLYACPLLIQAKVTLAGLALRITTGAASTTARLGIYSNVSGLPGALIAEGTQDVSTATSSSDVVATGGLNVTLNPGVYWGAACFSGTPTVNNVDQAKANLAALVGGSTLVLAGSSLAIARVTRTAALTYVAGSPFLPASFGAATLAAGSPGSPYILLAT